MAIHAHITAAAGDVSADPIVSAIAAYRAGMAAFNATDEADWPKLGGEDAVVERTYLAPMRVLDSWGFPAKTRDGAAEALRVALEEIRSFGTDGATVSMITAALGYLEAH